MHRTLHRSYFILPLVALLVAGCADAPTSASLSPGARSAILGDCANDPSAADCQEPPPPAEEPPPTGDFPSEWDATPPLEVRAHTLEREFSQMDSPSSASSAFVALGGREVGTMVFPPGCDLEYTECVMQCLDARFSFWENWGNFWQADWDYGEAWMTGRTHLMQRPINDMHTHLYNMKQASSKFKRMDCKQYVR